MTEHPTPGSPLSADGVGLLKRGDEIEFCQIRYGTLGTYKAGQKVVFLNLDEDGYSTLIDGPFGEDAWPLNYFRLPIDRRAEADTPPSAGLDAGLETVAKLQSTDLVWTEAGLRLPLPPEGEEVELVTRQSAAAALEAAAEEIAALGRDLDAISKQAWDADDRATHAEARVADRDKRIAELEAALQTARGFHQVTHIHAALDQALSAIPTPGRE